MSKQYRAKERQIGSAVYNSLIPNMASRESLPAAGTKPAFSVPLLCMIFLASVTAQATNWSGLEQQLARRIVAVTGPSVVAMTIANRSSLSRRDADIVSGGLRAALEALGVRSANTDQAPVTVRITLSENAQSYVWVAQIRHNSTETVALVSASRENAPFPPTHDAAPMNLRKIWLWSQQSRILDVAVLEESSAPARIAVLDADAVSLYRMQAGKWQLEQSLEVKHSHPWPRDLRGRLIPAKDHLLDVYLPGAVCHTGSGSPLTLNCREGDDPWPLFAAAPVSGPFQTSAFFASNRNFFTGAVVPGLSTFPTVPKFYSAAFLPREKSVLWFFAAIDGSVHMIDGSNDLPTSLSWGSNLTTVKTPCGANWQVLATGPGDQNGNFVRAFEFPGQDAIPVSPPVDFNGEVTALWTEARNDSAIAVIQEQGTMNYEAFRLAIDCSQ